MDEAAVGVGVPVVADEDGAAFLEQARLFALAAVSASGTIDASCLNGHMRQGHPGDRESGRDQAAGRPAARRRHLAQAVDGQRRLGIALTRLRPSKDSVR